MVSPRKSRKKSACFSRTMTSTPVRARRSPSIIPAGPPPTMQQRVASTSGTEDEVNGPHKAETRPQIIQFERLAHVEHREGNKDRQRDGFLHDFELRQVQLRVADAVGGDLQ